MEPKRRFLSAVLCLGLSALASAVAFAGNPPANGDEETLKAAGQKSDGPGLLEFFRKRTLTRDGQEQIEKQISQLGDRDYKTRVKAENHLVGCGTAALPFLRQALKSLDREVVRRAEECIRRIEERDARGDLTLAAVRLLAQKRPAGAAEVLLGYLPFAEDELVAEEVQTALVTIAARESKLDPAILLALHDPVSIRRQAAAETICRAGTPEQRGAVRPLLHDADPQVRLHAALALALAKEREAIPVLIDLLNEVAPSGGWQALDVLMRLAGEQSPTTVLGTDATARRETRDAWAAWWHHHGAKADLSRLEGSGKTLGYTLLVLLNMGRVIELDAENKTRFQVDGLLLPLDVQMLPGDHLLAAEHDGNRVTERDRKGEVVWEYKVNQPLMAQRLPNGHTFIATPFELLEVDRAGKQTFGHLWGPNEFIMKALKLPNGDIACVTSRPCRFLRLDATGKELQSFPVNVNTSGGRIEVLPGRRVLVPEKLKNRVVEYDAKGRVIWQVPFDQPVAAVRLASGNTLVTAYNQQRAVELDTSGKVVWEYNADARVTRAFRR